VHWRRGDNCERRNPNHVFSYCRPIDKWNFKREPMPASSGGGATTTAAATTNVPLYLAHPPVSRAQQYLMRGFTPVLGSFVRNASHLHSALASDADMQPGDVLMLFLMELQLLVHARHCYSIAGHTSLRRILDESRIALGKAACELVHVRDDGSSSLRKVLKADFADMRATRRLEQLEDIVLAQQRAETERERHGFDTHRDNRNNRNNNRNSHSRNGGNEAGVDQNEGGED
jgi:hypothetical protein